MIRCLTVFGTRPEAIKLSPLVKKLDVHPEINNLVCVTAQHRHMLDQVLTLFEIKPDFDLDLMKANQDLFDLTSRILVAMRSVLNKVKPDLVFVQGDTTTTFATALAAFYAGVPIAHVEAGLRTYDLRAPFPEEANRCLTSRLANLHFCPTSLNRENLLKEGINADGIYVTGNTVIDALLWVKRKIQNACPDRWKDELSSAYPIINSHPFVLITGHRRENFGSGMKNICMAVKTIACSYPEWHFIYPVHMNPNVTDVVYHVLGDQPNVHLIKPLEYESFVYLLNKAKFILTDSGGVQEEAPALGKPVLVMRDKTEREEGVAAGTVKLVGTDYNSIVENTERLMFDDDLYIKMAGAVNPYGDGTACDRIINMIPGALGQ